MPHPAVILGIDPAKLSGWALATEVSPVFTLSGTAKTPRDRIAVIETALLAGKKRSLPVIGVIEDFTPGGWKSFVAILRSGEARGRWLEHLERAEIPIANVDPGTWRTGIFGKHAARMTRDAAKTLAQTHVRALLKKEVSHDEAEAILLARYGCRCKEVASLLT